jgi:hypothetical protein
LRTHRPLALNIELLEMLASALRDHGIEAVVRGDRVIVQRGRMHLAAALWEHPSAEGRHAVVLEVVCVSPLLGDRPLVENIAGFGNSLTAAQAQAFGKFLLNIFHVLIEALTPHACAQPQCDVELWQRGDRKWRVYLGPLLQQHSSAFVFGDAQREFMGALQECFLREASPGPHWVRVFLGSFHNQIQSTEALLDNDPWSAGLALMQSWTWPVSDEYQSFRYIFIALPMDGEVRKRSQWARLKDWLSPVR